MRISVIGLPGSGKTTQAEILAKKLSLPYTSMGALLREAATKKTKLGRQIKLVLEKGELVDDSLALNFFFRRIKEGDCRRGFIADGTPRTFYQVKKLEERLPFDKVIFVEVSLPIAKERLLKRGRADDTEEAITHRFQLYKETTQPILEVYRKKGRLIEVDGEGLPEKVAAEIFERLSDGDRN